MARLRDTLGALAGLVVTDSWRRRKEALLADFNPDGKLDMAAVGAGTSCVSVGISNNIVAALFGNGVGGFQFGGAYSTGEFPYSAALGTSTPTASPTWRSSITIRTPCH